jgi:hypothetical protein
VTLVMAAAPTVRLRGNWSTCSPNSPKLRRCGQRSKRNDANGDRMKPNAIMLMLGGVLLMSVAFLGDTETPDKPDVR